MTRLRCFEAAWEITSGPINWAQSSSPAKYAWRKSSDIEGTQSPDRMKTTYRGLQQGQKVDLGMSQGGLLGQDESSHEGSASWFSSWILGKSISCGLRSSPIRRPSSGKDELLTPPGFVFFVLRRDTWPQRGWLSQWWGWRRSPRRSRWRRCTPVGSLLQRRPGEVSEERGRPHWGWSWRQPALLDSQPRTGKSRCRPGLSWARSAHSSRSPRPGRCSCSSRGACRCRSPSSTRCWSTGPCTSSWLTPLGLTSPCTPTTCSSPEFLRIRSHGQTKWRKGPELFLGTMMSGRPAVCMLAPSVNVCVLLGGKS